MSSNMSWPGISVSFCFVWKLFFFLTSYGEEGSASGWSLEVGCFPSHLHRISSWKIIFTLVCCNVCNDVEYLRVACVSGHRQIILTSSVVLRFTY